MTRTRGSRTRLGRIVAVAGVLVGVLLGAGPAAADADDDVVPIEARESVVPIELDGAVEPLESQRVEGNKVTIDIKTDVLFAFDSARLTPDARTHLRDLATKLTNVQGTIRVDGHTDSLGPTSYNQNLSQRRAEAVKRELANTLGGGFTIVAAGHGEAQPIAPNTRGGKDNPRGRAKNRRVTITYTNG
ncbi:MAG: OmpA family protein [Streptosporangiales bacterium]|nr:OmpA family protein [Streptosporangiales bacterium]